MDDSVISPGNKIDNSASEIDSSSLDGGAMLPPTTVSRDQLQKTIESLQQQNRDLKVELDTYKLREKASQEENRAQRQASVSILRQEKTRLEQTLEQEQECLVNNMQKIEKLVAETLAKQSNLERLRREKMELENTLERQQEAFVNRLWKRMDKLEADKRSLQIRLDQPVSDPASPRDNGRQTLVRCKEQQRPVQGVPLPPMQSQQVPRHDNNDPPSGPSEQSSDPQSAKMLIFLPNGEERLITFSLPKESCTLQEILEQVNVPFSEDTHIQCMQQMSSEIDYYVSVGSTSRIEELLENHPHWKEG